MQTEDDAWDKTVKHYLKLRGYDVANYRGDYFDNPFSVTTPGNQGYVIGDIVRHTGDTLYMSQVETFDSPNNDDPLSSNNWLALNLEHFTEHREFDLPRQTNQLRTKSVTTDINFAISPVGNGGILTAIPDGAAGGDHRGTYAIDLQLFRSSPTQVASGNFSVIGGGQLNRADSLYSTVSGGSFNRAISEASTVAGGDTNLASGFTATISGGRNNEATLISATVAGGSFNDATGTNSTVSGGTDNVASGTRSVVIGGQGNIASATSSVACGQFNQNGQLGGIERIFMVGNGASNASRNNLFSITADGNCHAQGFVPGAADFAEWMESSLQEKIPLGTPVLIDQGKIRPAKRDEIPCGVISEAPGLIGNSAEAEWYYKYQRTRGGKLIMETYQETEEVPKTITKKITIKKLVKQTDSTGTYYVEQDVEKEISEPVYQEIPVKVDGKIVRTIREPVTTPVTLTGTRRQLNPKFDSTKIYIPRSQRSEWNLVGLLGQVPIRKDLPKNPAWQFIHNIDDQLDLYLIYPTN